MMKDAQSDQFLNHVIQDVPLYKLKEVVRSCYFDENLRFCAIFTEIKDNSLKEKFGGNNYLLEVWSDGELLYQRPLKKKVRVLNATRQANSIIYMLDPEDEVMEGNFIHIVSLNSCCIDKVSHNDNLNEDRNFDSIKVRKIVDWTGLCA